MKKMIVILSLALSLALCVGALAEQTPTADPAETTAQVETAAEQDPTKAAVDAYKALKKSAKAEKKLAALKEELDAYVADGKLTQEQADLVLKYYTEKLSSHGEKSAKKEQTSGKTGGKGQQKQKNNAQTTNSNAQPTNGKGGKRTKPAGSGSTGTDTVSGATKKGK